MPIIKARTGRIETVRYVCRLHKPNRDALLAYAAFIGDTPDYVLNALVSATLTKDRDFLAWQVAHGATPSAAPVPPENTQPSSTPRSTPKV
jgi:hypothetical protein